MRLGIIAAAFVACLTAQALAQRAVSFPALNPAETIQADLYGAGKHGVILAHGGRFDKESWKTQANELAAAGFLVLAIRFRGDGLNPDGSPGSFGSDANNAADVLAAAAYLRHSGAETVYAVGGSFGGDAVGNADASSPGAFERIVILASSGGETPEKLTGRKLFIVARDDASADGPRLPEISSHYARVPQPKTLIVLDGSAHAQFLFATDQGPRLMKEILSFLKAP